MSEDESIDRSLRFIGVEPTDEARAKMRAMRIANDEFLRKAGRESFEQWSPPAESPAPTDEAVRMSVPCIVCDRELRAVFAEPSSLEAHHAVVCRTSGSYGSRVLDEVDPRFHVAFTLCDECLVRAAQNRKLVKIEHRTIVKESASPWVPEEGQ